MALKLSDYILLLLYCGLERYDAGLETFYHPYKALYGYTEKWKKDTIRSGVAQLKKKRLIERAVVKGEVCFKITSEGKEKVTRILPMRSLRERRWDRLWRLVIFDIPEKRRQLRDDLRKKLKELSFAQWQKSVWVTPLDVGEEISKYLASIKLSPLSSTLLVKRMYQINEKDFARRIWRLDQLEKDYQRIIKEAKAIKASKRASEEILKKAKVLILDYWELLAKDPFLPYDLLPSGWKEMERTTRREITGVVKFIRSY